MSAISTSPAVAERLSEPLFEQLYRSSFEDVYGYVATLLHDRSAAEDVTAAAFERAYRKRGTYRPRKGSPRAWLFGIARNAALDELRRRGRAAALPDDLRDTRQASPLESADLAVRRATVRAALGQLGARERELVALKFHGGLTNSELARVLDVSESNAGTLLYRAITKLRKACDEAAS
jgi:RNA polymerase sigma-70 factor (ECF subfamily)